jgi:hypothetical protein
MMVQDMVATALAVVRRMISPLQGSTISLLRRHMGSKALRMDKAMIRTDMVGSRVGVASTMDIINPRLGRMGSIKLMNLCE